MNTLKLKLGAPILGASSVRLTRGLICLIWITGVCAVSAADDAAWPSIVKGFVAPQAGEHPRLFFRKADLPKLRERAATPDGKRIIDRCIYLLDGAESVRDAKAFTLWDGAAFGFLFQITGDKKYAALGRKSVEKIWAGAIDRDDRYSLVPPNEPMRAGPSLSAVAMAYDLCYDGWDADFRKDQAQKIITWKAKCKKRGGDVSLEQLSLKPDNPNPISNHFGLQVGGAGLTILALKGDPELTADQQTLLDKFQQGVDKNAIKVMTEDFGEGGYFGEHAGPGVISMTWTFTPWLLAQKVCAGRDWLSNPAHPNPEWMSLRFVMQLLPTEKGPMYTNPSAGRGGYGGDELVQEGGHHSTYFVQGFGAIKPERRAAMLWVYNNFVEPLEKKQYGPGAKTLTADTANKPLLREGERSFDVFSYPHRSLFALVNWPFDIQPENPEKTVPKVAADSRMGQYIFRNRWQDKDDIIVAVLFGSRTSDKVRRMMVWGLGQQMTFGNIAPSVEGGGKISKAKVDFFNAAEDGSGAVSAGSNAIGVDYSKASGADALVVMCGPGASGALSGGVDKAKSKVFKLEAGGKTFQILSLSADGKHPEPKVDGDKIVAGGQTIGFDGKAITFAKIAGPLKIKQ